MANDTVEIQIVVKGAEQAKRELKEVQSSLKVADIALGSFLGNLSAAAFTAGIRGLQDLAGATLGFVESSLKSADALQQNRIAYETMLGSAEKAKTLLRDLNSFAMKTPFNLGELQELTKRLLAYGFAQEDIIPKLKTLGNIAAGVGRDKLPLLILALGQVKAATKLTGAELRQFTEAGVPLLDELAKQTGKSVGEIREIMTNPNDGLEITYEQVARALDGLSGPGGRFEGLMDRQSKTLGGLQSNLQDFGDSLMRTIGGITVEGDIIEGGLLDTVQNSLTSLMKFLDENRDTIQQFGADIGKGFGAFANEILPRIVENLPQITESLKGFFSSAKENFPTTLQHFRDLLTTLNDLKNVADFTLNAMKLGFESLALAGYKVVEMNLQLQIKFQELFGQPVSPELKMGLENVQRTIQDLETEINNTSIYMANLNSGTDLSNTKAQIDSAKESLDRVNNTSLSQVTGQINGARHNTSTYIDAANRATSTTLGLDRTSLGNVRGQLYSTRDAANSLAGSASNAANQLGKIGQSTSNLNYLARLGRYAEGGIIGGSSYSGDKQLARVNSGEMIINKNDQSALFRFIKNMGSKPQTVINANANFTTGSRSESQQFNTFMQMLQGY